MPGRLLLAALLAVGLSPDGRPAATGTIRGRLTIAVTPRPMDRPSVADPTARRPEIVDRRRSVVYLGDGPVPAFYELRAGRARMDQRGEQFSPRVLAITVGTTVDFPNNDITFHNVFSLSRVKPFDLGRYKPGKTGAVVFDHPGIVPVFCDIHSHMSAYILVFSHPFFSLTNDNGDYSISGIPPGTYTVLVWSELGRAQPRLVTLSGSETVEADFRVGRDGS
jgi:plastocyanin